MDSKIVTADGTETFINEEYNEAYHSTKAGAYTESLHKFIRPTKILEKALKNKEIYILDVGFGLGYNVATAVKHIRDLSKDVSIHIISIEKDKDVFEKIRQLNIPDSLKSTYEIILSGNIEGDIYSVKEEYLDLKVIFGEGRQILKKLSEEDIKFDAVFYDPFSPKVNTEMWTVNVFRIVKRLMKDDGILATYSASLAVRKGLIEAGFRIGLVEPVGRKSYSTVATVSGDIPPLTEKEKKRLESSPYAVPFYDNDDLTLKKEDIKNSWELKISKNFNNIK
ncbi:tRNA (5-methylaminomethyl-2-thiouridine)(34)-methyltransferase MnmD [Persephonella sp.]